MEKQVVSKQRVADHGEVLTGRREVNAMLDLVKSETERIDSRFLEPACGTGNFLAEILERKLRVVESRYGKSQLEFERYAILAVSECARRSDSPPTRRWPQSCSRPARQHPA